MWRQKLGGIVGGGNRAIQSLRTSARIRKINANATVVTEVGPGGSAADIEYWKQGSADMYTQDALEKRAMARDDPQVRHWLQVWWETAHRSLKKKAKPKGRAKAQSPKSKASRKKAAAKATESDAELDVSAHEISKAQYGAPASHAKTPKLNQRHVSRSHPRRLFCATQVRCDDEKVVQGHDRRIRRG